MVKSLIGLSAVLSLSLLATAATAAGPRPARLDKADQLARPAPVALEHFRHSATHASRNAATVEPRSQQSKRPAKLQREQIRTEVVVGSSSRTVTHTSPVSSAGRTSAQNPVRSRVAQRARCEDSTACGSHSQAGSTRMVSSNTQRDGVSEMRRHLRNERLYRMIMGKIMMKMHPGK